MEAWNREELYTEIWEQPMLKLAPKYGISGVMLGKVCRKLRIPVPGRGYWARKQSGKKVSRSPLPTAKNLPTVYRSEFRPEASKSAQPAAPEPTDPEYLRIKQVESRTIRIDQDARSHSLVTATAKLLKSMPADDKGRMSSPRNHTCLRLLVSKANSDRALRILNSVLFSLDEEGFPVSIKKENPEPVIKIFGQEVTFSIVETYRQIKVAKSERELSLFSPRMRYEPTGLLEFRVSAGSWGGSSLREGKRLRLEDELSRLVGLVMREGRLEGIRAENRRQEEIQNRRRELERQELAQQVQEEEKRVADLDSWVASWARANQYREFILALEKTWAASGHDLSAESEKGKRILWMRQQADRLDPLVASPPSILDRKHELNRYRY